MFYETLTTNVFMTSNNKTTNSQIHEVKCCIKAREAVFQTFWKVHCCTKFLFFELETSNFIYVLAYFLIILNCAKFK